MKRNWIKLTLAAMALALGIWGCDSPTAPTGNDDTQTTTPPPPPRPDPEPEPKPIYEEVEIDGAMISNLFPQVWNQEADRDFTGHGPNVMVRALVHKVSPVRLELQIWLDAKETTQDFTETNGYWEYSWYTAPNGWVIDAILGTYDSTIRYRDTDHDYDYPTIPSGSFITYLKVKGDTDGNDVGNDTFDDVHIARIDIGTVKVRLRKL